MPAERAERQRKRMARKAGKSGHKLDARTTTAAGYLILATSLSAQAQPAERIIEMYRNRWQIELGFKRLKTLGGLDRLPAMDPALARTWLLAQLIVAVLTDEIASEIVGFPPLSRPLSAAGECPSGAPGRSPIAPSSGPYCQPQESEPGRPPTPCATHWPRRQGREPYNAQT